MARRKTEPWSRPKKTFSKMVSSLFSSELYRYPSLTCFSSFFSASIFLFNSYKPGRTRYGSIAPFTKKAPINSIELSAMVNTPVVMASEILADLLIFILNRHRFGYYCLGTQLLPLDFDVGKTHGSVAQTERDGSQVIHSFMGFCVVLKNQQSFWLL